MLIGSMSAVTTVVDDDRGQTELSKRKTGYFITCIPPLGQRPEYSFNGFPRVIGVTHPVTVFLEIPHRVTDDVRLD